MKQKKFLLLSTILVGVISVACSNDSENNEPEMPSVKMVLNSIYGGYPSSSDPESYGVRFEDAQYDTQGRILSYKEYDGDLVLYTYSSSSITKSDSGEEWQYNLNADGLIISDSKGNRFEYDSNKQLISDGDDNFVWSNGNMVKSGSDTYVYTTYFNTVSCFIQFLFSTVYFDNCDPFLMASGFYGKIPKNLVDKYYSDGDLGWNFLYEFNSNGYPTKITTSDASYDAIYTLSWKNL